MIICWYQISLFNISNFSRFRKNILFTHQNKSKHILVNQGPILVSMKSIIIYNNYSFALKMTPTTAYTVSSMPYLVVFVGLARHINALKPSFKLVSDTEFDKIRHQDKLNHTFIPFIYDGYFSTTLSQFLLDLWYFLFMYHRCYIFASQTKIISRWFCRLRIVIRNASFRFLMYLSDWTLVDFSCYG